MSNTDIYRVALLVISALEDLGVPYHVGGSLASMAHGVPRTTLDADIVVGLAPAKVAEFLARLGPGFVSNPEALADSLRKKRSNNLIHFETMLKVDLYPAKDDPFSQSEAARRQQRNLPGLAGRPVWCCSAEDIVLRKLTWYRDGGQVAWRQWEDAVQVLKMQAGRLDLAYQRHWAEFLGAGELLERALKEAAGPPTA